MIITLEKAKISVIKNINYSFKLKPELKNNIKKIKIIIVRDTLGIISFVIKCPPENAKAITEIIEEQWFQYENEYSETESFKEWLGGVFINDDDTFNLFAEDIKLNELSLEKGAENIPWLEEAIQLESWRERNSASLKQGAKVISFYSYKGGVGRTTLTAMISLLCAQKDKKIVVVDTDLEAPGLGFQFFGESGKAGYQSCGFLDFMLYPYQNLASDKQTLFKQTFVSEFFIQNQHDLPNILLMPAAKFGDDITCDAYSEKLSRINVLQGGQEKIHLLLELINEKIKPDLIIFDLRTGITDIGGILTSQSVSDFLIFVGYPDTQTQLGLSFFFKHATKFDHLDDENRANFNTIFVNSPAPVDDKKKIIPTELDSFRHMINVYVDKFYGDKKDEAMETLEEFIFTIPYQANLRSLIREKGIKEVFKDGDFEYDNYYQSIAEKILLLNSDEKTASTETTASMDVQTIFDEFKEKLKTTPLIDGGADAETDLHNMEDIIVNFQVLRDYREMLNDRIFLIIGEKGAGKSALEKVFDESKSEKLVEALVKKLDINWDMKKPTWIPATDKGFVMEHFIYDNEIHDIINENYEFWKIYSLGLIENFLKNNSFKPQYREDVINDMIGVYQKNPVQLNHMYDEKLIHDQLKTQRIKVVLTYDYLDIPEYDISSKSIKQLMLLWYRLKLNPDSYLNAKIFLREDLVQKIKWADKGKMRSNHGYEIRWDFDKLMTVFLKRLCARSEKFFEKLKTELSKNDILLDKTLFDDNKHIIFFPEKPEAVDIAIKLLFGEKITQSSSKSFLERYLWNGTTLQNKKQYNARFMLKFMHSALEECEQPAKDGIFDIYTPLKQKYGNIAREWIEQEVYEMYPKLEPYIEKIKEKATTESENFKGGRINASQLKDYLTNKGEDEKIKIMKDLENIGFIQIKKGDYDDIAKLEFYFPELYRAFLGIKKVNSLPPS